MYVEFRRTITDDSKKGYAYYTNLDLESQMTKLCRVTVLHNRTLQIVWGGALLVLHRTIFYQRGGDRGMQLSYFLPKRRFSNALFIHLQTAVHDW